jgi:hypothetical protein
MLQFTKKEGVTLISNPLQVHAAAGKEAKAKRIYLSDAGGKRDKIVISSNNSKSVTASISSHPYNGPKGMWTVDLRIGVAGKAVVTATHEHESIQLNVLVGARLELPTREPYLMLTDLFLSENPTPEDPGYNAVEVEISMKWMWVVLQNRRKDPVRFGAANGALESIVKADGQVKGFENYPVIAKKQKSRLETIIDRANDDEHPQQAAYERLLETATMVANFTLMEDPCPTGLYGWRTIGSKSPGGDFVEWKQKAGNQFYTLKDKKTK